MPSHGRFRYLEALPPADVRGRGTLVLLHAFPLNAHMWEEQLEHANRGWRVIAPHLRGFDGATTDPPASSVDDYAADVIDLLDGLHVHEAVVGGLSMGGYLAFAIFRHAPRYVHALILADTRSQADTPEAVQGRERMLQLVDDKGPAAIADEMIPKLLGETTRRLQGDIVARVRALVLTNSTAAIAGALRALMTRPDSTPLLSTIRCPTLILVGSEDALTPPALAEELHQGIAGSERVVVPAAGHLSNLEQPAAFNAALARFLDHRV
jgi:3-oxoadipate enol-lactonase